MFGLTGAGEVIRSTNRGVTWEEIFSTEEELDHLAISPGGVVCVATDVSAFCSTDLEFWDEYPIVVEDELISGLAFVDGIGLFTSRWWNGGGGPIEFAKRFDADLGTWVYAGHSAIGSIHEFIIGADGWFYVTAPEWMYAFGSFNGGFFRWSDQQSEWEQLYSGTVLGALVLENGEAIISTLDSLLWNGPQPLSSPSGKILTTHSGTLLANSTIYCFVDYDVPLYCLEPSGSYRLDGDVWHQAGFITAPVLSLLESNDGKIYAGTESSVFVVRDGGWSGAGWNYGRANDLETVGDSVYVAGSAVDNSFSTGLIPVGRSTPVPVTNGCEFWNCNAHSVAATASNTLLVGLAPGGFGHGGGDFGIFRSVDGGQTWMDTLADVGEIRSMYDVGGDVVLAGVRSSAPGHPTPAPGTKGVYRSDDDGQTWSLSNSGLANTEVHSLYSSGGIEYAGTEDGVFVSFRGAPWSADGLPGTTVYAFVDARDGLLAGTSSGLFRRIAPNVWEAYGTGLEDRSVLSLLVTQLELDELIVVGTDAGVYLSRPGLITVGQEQPARPISATRLHPPFPNPAHDLVTLRFDLEHASHVRIRAFDALGREVAKPVDGQFQAGSHQTTWRVSGLASGVYLLRIEAGDMHSTQRVIVLR